MIRCRLKYYDATVNDERKMKNEKSKNSPQRSHRVTHCCPCLDIVTWRNGENCSKNDSMAPIHYITPFPALFGSILAIAKFSLFDLTGSYFTSTRLHIYNAFFKLPRY